jgi:hypothetical protein
VSGTPTKPSAGDLDLESKTAAICFKDCAGFFRRLFSAPATLFDACPHVKRVESTLSLREKQTTGFENTFRLIAE